MDWILSRLALGSFEDAEAVVRAGEGSIALLTLCERRVAAAGHPVYHSSITDEVYHQRHIWARLVRSLGSILLKRERVLVHCRLGKSRSPALVAVYLAACGHSEDPAMALEYVHTLHWETAVHPETWRGVMDFWRAR